VVTQCLSPDVHLDLLGRVWCEPTTVITDWLLTLQLVWLAALSRGRARGYFLLMGLAFMVGGARHLLHHQAPDAIASMSILQNCASSGALGLLAGLLAVGRGARWRGRADGVYGAMALLFVLGHLTLGGFGLTVAHQALALLAAAGVVVAQGRWSQYRGFLIHVALGAGCALIYALRIGAHPWVDHNVLAHLLMVPAFLALWLQLRSLGWSRPA